jgi:UDP-N-acetylglucosamine 2-epimerase (non-hydrolysing)
LQQLLRALQEIATAEGFPLFFPVHPRTRARMQGQPLSECLHLLEPLGYTEFVALMSNAVVVFTDSGGVQEETTALGIPCLTLRNNTERPITIEQGTNHLAGTSYESILKSWSVLQINPKCGNIPPLWDGQAAFRCIDAIRNTFSSGKKMG